MKNIINNNHCLTLLVMLFAFTSCEKSLMNFEGPESIYFSMQENANPESNYFLTETSINLMNYMGSELEYGLNVVATGNVKDYDRPYRVSIVADSTTAEAGIDYVLPEGGVIKAGQISDSLYVKLIKNDKLQNTEVTLSVQVLPNEHFSTNFSQFAHDGRYYNVFDPRVYNFTFTTMMTEPWWWPYDSKSNPKEGSDLGKFTVKKITMINEFYGFTYADWGEDSERMDVTRLEVIYKKFSRYLIEQYKNGTPVLEEDGRLMWVKGCPWTSYVGEPWDGTFIEIND